MLNRVVMLTAAASCASAFAPSTLSSLPVRTSRAFASAASTTVKMSSKINHKIELDNPKVATQETLEPGQKAVYCRCWKSATFPKCDGAHNKHNQETGDNVGPIIVNVSK